MLLARLEHDYEMRDGSRHFARDIVRNENGELLVRKSGSRSPDENPSFVPLSESRQCAESPALGSRYWAGSWNADRSGTTKAASPRDRRRDQRKHSWKEHTPLIPLSHRTPPHTRGDVGFLGSSLHLILFKA